MSPLCRFVVCGVTYGNFSSAAAAKEPSVDVDATVAYIRTVRVQHGVTGTTHTHSTSSALLAPLTILGSGVLVCSEWDCPLSWRLWSRHPGVTVNGVPVVLLLQFNALSDNPQKGTEGRRAEGFTPDLLTGLKYYGNRCVDGAWGITVAGVCV